MIVDEKKSDKLERQAVVKLQGDIEKQGGRPTGVQLDSLAKLAIGVLGQKEDIEREWWFKVTRYVKATANAVYMKTQNSYYLDLYWQMMLAEAPYLFESFLFYMEKNRPPQERFYEPRQKVLHEVANAVQDLADDNLDEIFINMPPRCGKLLADDTPILTSKGWKNHGDLEVGDEVIGSDGKYTKIVHVHPKYHTTHTVRTTDGGVYECHYRHEWTVYDRSLGKYVTRETQMLFGKEKYFEGEKERSRFMLPPRPVMQGTRQDLPIDPYVFGAWLGDGTNQKPRLTNDPNDMAIIDEFERRGYQVSRKYIHKTYGTISCEFDRLKDELRAIGFCQRSHRVEKYVPEIYLIADVEQRLDLLAGLLDTDGSLVKKEHRYHFSSTDEALIEAVEVLARSFGWRTSRKEYEPKVSTSGIVGRNKVYRTAFNPTFEIPCKLERKQLKEFSKPRRVAIESIEPSEHKQGNCITVANDDGLYLAGKHLTPTHNTQMVKLALTWFAGRDPERSNLYSAFSDKITTANYNGCLELMTDITYTYSEIFPKAMAVKPFTNSIDETIDLARKKTYPSITNRSIYGTLNGSCDCSGLAVDDDLFSGVEEALSADRQDKVWDLFDNNFMPRQKMSAKLINMGTRWALKDVQGRRMNLLEFNPEYFSRRWRAIVIPALDENDESNFDYDYGVGFSTEYFRQRRASFIERGDIASWEAQYMQRPVDRLGTKFEADKLRYFKKADIRDLIPDRVFAHVDEAFGGGDYVSMPICYQFGDDGYVVDCVFDKHDKYVTRPRIVQKAIDHEMNAICFEETKTTEEYRTWCEDRWKEEDFSIRSYGQFSTNTKKELRIDDKAPEIRELFFLVPEERDQDYKDFMLNLLTYTDTGRNTHDDAPDSLAGLCEMKNHMRKRKVRAGFNPFR